MRSYVPGDTVTIPYDPAKAVVLPTGKLAAGAEARHDMGRSGWLGIYFTRNGYAWAPPSCSAVLFWILLMIVLPQVAMLDFSFRYDLPPARAAADRRTSTRSANYRYFFFGYPGNPDGYNYVDLAVFGRTLVAARLCHDPQSHPLLSDRLLPGAGRARAAWRAVLAIALIVPYWVNEILRAFAFRVIFGATGVHQQRSDLARPDRRCRSTSSARTWRSMPALPMPICC